MRDNVVMISDRIELSSMALSSSQKPNLAGLSRQVEECGYALAGEVPASLIVSILKVSAELDRLGEMIQGHQES